MPGPGEQAQRVDREDGGRSASGAVGPPWFYHLLLRRSRPGAAVHPLSFLLVAVVGDLFFLRPWVAGGAVVIFALLTVHRLFYLLRFEGRNPEDWRRWQWLFNGNLVLGSATLGIVCGVVLDLHGLSGPAAVALIAPGVISSLAVIVYNPVPWLARALMLAVGLPSIVVLVGMGTRISAGVAISCLVYAWVLDRLLARLHRDARLAEAKKRQLAAYTAELEEAHAELAKGRLELEEKVAERTALLARREQEYRTIFEQAHDAIFVIDPKTEEVLQANQRAGEVYGVPADELVGRSMIEFSVNVERGREKVDETLESGQMVHFETLQKRADGADMILEVNASVIEHRGRTAILSINRDITERRQAEKLRIAKELAERSNEAKGRFLANMSHEVRTPMNGILGLSELLLESELPARQRQHLELLHQSATGLLRILDDVLDFSQIDTGDLALTYAPFELARVADGVVELLWHRAEAKGLALKLAVDERLPPWVVGDRLRLRQVLVNLIDNAIKFTETGEVSLVVEPVAELLAGPGDEPVEEPTAGVRFAIRDTGIGIPVEHRTRIFDPFHQVDDSMSRAAGGTGLGLAIARQLVALMGGTLELADSGPAGTTLTFTLTLAIAAEPVT